MRARYIFFLLIISLYLIVWTSYSLILDVPYNSKRLTEGFILVLGTAIICSSLTIQQQWLMLINRWRNKIGWMAGAFISLVGLGIVSSVLADFPGSAFLQLSHYFLLLNVLVLAALAYRFEPKYFEYGLLTAIGLMAGLYLVNVGISYLYTFFIPDFPLWPSTDFTRIRIEGLGFKYPKPFSNFVNVRFFNHLQTWSLPLLALLVIYIPKRYWAFSRIVFIITCGWWMLVFASDARGTMLASFLALGFVFYFYKTKAKQWLKTHSLSAGIGFVLYGIFFKLLPLLLVSAKSGRTAFTRYNEKRRFEVWEVALDSIVENPIWGIGPLHFGQWGMATNFAPHNIYLQLMTEWGLIAGVLFIIIIATGVYCWLVRTNKVVEDAVPNSKEVNIRVALTASLLAALIHGLVSNIFNSPLSQIMMVLVVGWMIGLSVTYSFKEGEFVGQWKRSGLIAVNILAAGFLIWSYVQDVPNLDENRIKYLKVTKENRLYPRYWDQGVIGLDGSKVEEIGNPDQNAGHGAK